MTICKIFEIFLTGIFSALGAFVPIFLVMCVHFLLRKRVYKKETEFLLKLEEYQKNITKISEDALKDIYKSVEVEDFQGLMNRSDLEKSRYIKLISLANEHLNNLIKSREISNKTVVDISYLENYDFGTYLGSILDKRFPDKSSR